MAEVIYKRYQLSLHPEELAKRCKNFPVFTLLQIRLPVITLGPEKEMLVVRLYLGDMFLGLSASSSILFALTTSTGNFLVKFFEKLDILLSLFITLVP